jgi:hypothetical protein
MSESEMTRFAERTADLLGVGENRPFREGPGGRGARP